MNACRGILLFGGSIVLRKLTGDDADAFHVFVRQLSPEDLWLRFGGRPTRQTVRTYLFQPLSSKIEALGAFCRSGEMAVSACLGAVSDTELDVGLIVRSDLKGCGLGAAVMAALCDWPSAGEGSVLSATVLQENRRALRMLARQGFTRGARLGSLVQLSKRIG